MPPFIIYALPRSRTFWMSKFLTYGAWKCSHDICVDMHSIAEIQEFFSRPNVGTVETGMCEGWQLAQALFPDARRVVIRRNIDDVAASLAKHNIFIDDQLISRNTRLDEISQRPNVLTVTFDQLNTEAACKAVFEHCLQIPFDRDWWLWIKDQNIQIDMKKHLEILNRNMAGIERLHKEALLRIAS